jgi:hypothetical protein
MGRQVRCSPHELAANAAEALTVSTGLKMDPALVKLNGKTTALSIATHNGVTEVF